jgi:hypothetical protein
MEGDFRARLSIITRYLYRKKNAYVAGKYGRSRTNSRMQRKGTGISRVRWDILFPSAAAEHIHKLLHYALLLSLLLPWLLHVRAGCWYGAVVRYQVWLAVLELGLRGRCLGWRELAHALSLDLRITLHVLPWASSGLGAGRAGLGERLVQTVVVDW